jgi:CRP-like cAMP-binding protein
LFGRKSELILCERSSLFLGSHGKLFSKKISEQFSYSDSAYTLLHKNLKQWLKEPKLPSNCIKELESILKVWDDLTKIRNKIVKRELSTAHLIDYYSHKLIIPLLKSMTVIARNAQEGPSDFANTYEAFLQWKERIGLERAIGAKGLIGNNFHNTEFLERLLFLISEQKAYRNIYMTIANPAQKQIVTDALKKPASVELSRLHALLQTSPQSEALSQLSPEKLFNLVTSKIEDFYKVEKQLVEIICEKNLPPAQQNNQRTTHLSFSTALGEYEALVKSLPLFSGLTTESFSSLLQHGQIRDFPKGKLLFLEGEHANRFYIVLKGWIKIFKGTTSGEETTLQMLSAGDPIMESAVFLNTTFPVSAQVAENATLLSLPAPVIREQVRGDHKLALNLLANMSQHSQGSIRQIESARLKSADERVGWFLLKLLIEQGYRSKHIELPYDKSLIASYLDMKRETFSRSLKRLKEKGFSIENNTISIPDSRALCGFCDSNLNKKCKNRNTSHCFNYKPDTKHAS